MKTTCFLSHLAIGLLVAGPALAQGAPEPPPPPPLVAPPHGASVVPQVAPAPSPVPAPSPAEIARRRVTVDVESTRDDAVLERRVTTKESAGAFIVLPFKTVEQTWEQVCVAPCRGVELDRYSTYRIAPANKISGSSQFTLPQHEGPLRLKLDAGDLAAHRSGQALVGLGTAATIVGVVLLATASTFHHEDDARLAGWITTGGGVAALAVGIPLSLLTRTKVIADDGRTLGSAPGAIRF